MWTDEIGDDTNNQALEAEIINLRTQTKSVIFFMVVASGSGSGYGSGYGKVKRAVNETETSVGTPKENEDTDKIDDEAEQEDMDEDRNPDDVPSKKRILFNDFEARFGNIGYVMDITNDHDVISKVIEIMKNAAICSQ